MDKEEYYEVLIGCYNCRKEEMVSIPKGITVGKYRDGKICGCCGCKIGGEKSWA